MKPGRHIAMSLAAATIIGMPIIGYIIMSFFPETDFLTNMYGVSSIWIQAGVGLGVGVVGALGAMFIISLPFMRDAQLEYSGLIGSLKLRKSDKVYVSLCAGVGEEFLFRGVLQPLMGLWLTSCIFVAIHGYLRPSDWRISVYGIYMTLVVVVFGLITIYFGLLAAVVAHTIVDIILLIGFKETESGLNETLNDEENEESV
jgi:uncharacterized protein